MRQGALDVDSPESLVKKYTGGVTLNELAHRFTKKLRPGLGLLIKGIGRHRLTILLLAGRYLAIRASKCSIETANGPEGAFWIPLNSKTAQLGPFLTEKT
jgi:hypothetical protein